MRKTLLIAVLALLSYSIFAQKNKKQEIDIHPYDSTRNFLGKDVLQYTGQELFLKGLDKPSQK